MIRRALGFGVVCGLLAESVEVARLVTGGMEPPSGALRATLFVAYAAVAVSLRLAAGGLWRCAERARGAAAALFAMFVVLPWLNLDYLPRWDSAKTILSTLAAALVLAAVAPALARWRRLLPAAVVLVALAVNASTLAPARRAAGPDGARRAGAAPNVLLVLIDTLRADHLGAYGYARGTSPTFDRFAREGVVFERTVAQASWTKPSVASLFTGTFMHEHGVMSSRDALGTRLPTLAEVLRAGGYRTAAFSANPWITPEFRFDRGFDHFESGRAMSVQLTNLYRLVMRVERGLRRAGVWIPLNEWVFFAAAEPSLSNARRDELLTDAVIAWLQEQGEAPFFAYVHLIGPHDPYDPPARYAEPFRAARADDLPRLKRPPARVQSIFETAEPLDDAGLAGLVAQYDGAILYTDELLRRLLAALERRELDERTLVIVTSDHGEEFYEHGNWRHGNQLYDEVVHVPLALRLPERLAPQRRPDDAMSIDVFPTVLGLLDVPARPAHLRGRDLFAETSGSVPAVYSEHWRFEGGEYASHMVSRRQWKMKETRDSDGKSRVEIYDLGQDPRETNNLFGKVGGGEEAGELRELEALLVTFSGAVPVRGSAEVEVDRSTKERLRALGY
jgi:arylsulfatase A-like enzyme